MPAVGGADEVSGDTLDIVNVMAVTLGTLGEILLCVLVSAIHATVTVVVYRAVTDVILIHQINDIADSLRIMSGISVDLHIEYVATAGQLVIRSLDLGLVAGGGLVINRDGGGVGVVNNVSFSHMILTAVFRV